MDAKIKEEVGVRGGDSPPLHVEKKPLNSRAEKKKLDSNLSDLYKYTPTILLHLGFILFFARFFLRIDDDRWDENAQEEIHSIFSKKKYICVF